MSSEPQTDFDRLADSLDELGRAFHDALRPIVLPAVEWLNRKLGGERR